MRSQDSRTHIGRAIKLAGLAVVIALAVYPAMAQDISRLGQWYQQTEMEKGTAFAEFPAGPSNYVSTREPSWEPFYDEVLRRNGSWYNRPVREKGTAFAEFPEAAAPIFVPTPAPAPVVAPPPPAPAPTPAPKPAPAPEVKAPLDKIYFDYDKSDLRAASKDVLQKVAEYMKAKPDAKVTVQGHCDSVGSHTYNDPLSVRRANSAQDYLVNTLGIPASRIMTEGKGKRAPAASNDTAEGRQLNRRCEFIFSK